MSPANVLKTLVIRSPWLAATVMIAACDRTPTSYFPLDNERYWQYTIERTTMDGTVTQKYLLATLPNRTWEGVAVGTKRTVDGNEYLYRVDGDGVRRVARRLRGEDELRTDEPGLTVLPADPRVGANWRSTTHTSVLENSGPPWETLFRITRPVTLDYTIESVTDVVRVSAGEFHDCLRVVGNGTTNADVGNYIGRAVISVKVTEWYAPNVGLVRSQRVEMTDAEALNYGALRMELESYD